MADLNNAVFTLKTARDLRKLTLVDASKLMNISPSTLSLYERGKSYPRVDFLQRAAKVYGVKPEQIIIPTGEDLCLP